MRNPRVTVLMSVYNGEEHLREAIDGILNQTFKNFKFLIVNDGSTDRTGEILESYNDPRIRIHNNRKNIGLAKSLNIGLKMAKGEYIARQDADDISMPERLAKEIYFFCEHPDYAVVGTFAKIYNENSEQTGFWERPIKDTEIRKTLKERNCIIHGSTMIRMRCLLDVGFYDESMEKSQDFELWLRLSKKYKMANISSFLYIRRVHSKNIDIEYMKEQHIFLVLAKIKNNFVGIEEVTKQFINSISKYYFISLGFNSMFKLVSLITFKRINAYDIFRVFYKIRFTNNVKKTLNDFKLGKIKFDNAKLNLKKILNGGLLGFFL